MKIIDELLRESEIKACKKEGKKKKKNAKDSKILKIEINSRIVMMESEKYAN